MAPVSPPYLSDKHTAEFVEANYRTPLPDARFHQMNVTKWCFSTFVDHKKCLRLLGEKNPCCAQFAKIYKAICPNAWIEQWEDQIKEGTFQVDLPEPKDAKKP